MFKLFRKKNNRSLVTVPTTQEVNADTIDRNKNSIPDFLERKDMASIISSNKDLNQWEADTIEEVESWIMGLRGYGFDAEKNKYCPVAPPRMTETGIKAVETHLKPIVNKHSINTGLKLDEAHEIVKTQSSSFVSYLKNNASKIKVSYSDLTPIADEFDNFCFLVLSRSINDSQRGHVTRRTSLHGQVGGQQTGI